MTPLLRFSHREPRFLQSMLKRWYRALRLLHWTVETEMADSDQMENQSEDGDTMAEVRRVIPHKRATIRFNTELTEKESEWFVVHELRHLHYAEIEHVFYQAWNDLGGKMTYIQAHKLLMDTLEGLCERDAAILLDLAKRGKRDAD